LVVVARMVLHHDCPAYIGDVAIIVTVNSVRAQLQLFFCLSKNLGKIHFAQHGILL
jgi:hypothetical protein